MLGKGFIHCETTKNYVTKLDEKLIRHVVELGVNQLSPFIGTFDKGCKTEKLHEDKSWTSVQASIQHARRPMCPNPRSNKQSTQECSFRKYFVVYASIPHLYNLYITIFFMAFLDELLCLCHIKYWMLSVSRFLK